jgi:hypothetical protein
VSKDSSRQSSIATSMTGFYGRMVARFVAVPFFRRSVMKKLIVMMVVVLACGVVSVAIEATLPPFS